MFDYAQKAVVYPIAPLYDLESQRLSRQCKKALERIFILCDHDMDMTLNDHEFNELQVITLQKSCIRKVLCLLFVLTSFLFLLYFLFYGIQKQYRFLNRSSVVMLLYNLLQWWN